MYDIKVEEIANDIISLLEIDSDIERIFSIYERLIDYNISYGYELFSQMLISNLEDNHHSFGHYEKMDKLFVLLIDKARRHGEIHNSYDPVMINDIALNTYIGYVTA